MECPASPIEAATTTLEAAQVRRERSDVKLREFFGASVGSGRQIDAVEMANEVLEDGGPWRAGFDQPSRSRLEPTFVVALPRSLWESGSCCVVVFCVFVAGCFVGGAVATTALLFIMGI